MKWKRLFFVLLLAPNLIYSSFDDRDCSKVMDKFTAEWNRHNELVQQFTKLGPGEREQGVALLQESIACCVRAMGYCSKILTKIAEKSKKERYLLPWPQIKEQQQQHKSKLSAEISELQNVLNALLSGIAAEKAQAFYLESEKKVALANAKYKEYQALSSSDTDGAIASLNKAALFYEEAAMHAQQALCTLQAAPASQEADRAMLSQNIETYQDASRLCRQEAKG